MSDVSKEPDGSKVHEGSEVPDGSQEPERSGVANPSCKCVRFDARRNCYEITYRAVIDGESKTCRSIKGLNVKRQTKGKRLPPAQYNELMTKVYEGAKKLWNELDQSKRARFE